MAGMFGRFFGWWDGQSLGTALFTRRFGEKVGQDAVGNTYFRNADDTRRWVTYTGDNDASRVDAEWYGWLHKIYKLPPTEAPLTHKAWEKPHLANQSGSDGAYYRKGSLHRADVKPASDYEAWTPE